MTKDDARHSHGQGENREKIQIKDMIYEIRGQKVMLDSDLAALYEVETFNLNKAVKRNIERFPGDFRFQLTKDEWENLTFQNGISSSQLYFHSKNVFLFVIFTPYAPMKPSADCGCSLSTSAADSRYWRNLRQARNQAAVS